jgi:hypothetical protein
VEHVTPTTDPSPEGVLRVQGSGGDLLATVVRASADPPGVTFITETDASFQLGLMNRPRGEHIVAHHHREQIRTITDTQEVLVVRRGHLRAHFFDHSLSYVASVDLHQGDVALLQSGGHCFDVIEGVSLLELKQGPFLPTEDKVRFNGEEKLPETLNIIS